MTNSNSPDMESQGHLDLGIPRGMLVPALQPPAPRTEGQMSPVNQRMSAIVPETPGICTHSRVVQHLMWYGGANSPAQ